jgi:hypothetical protein
MLHQHMTLEERRLMAREGSREWEFTHRNDFRWLLLLGALVIAVALAFALTMWISGASMLP